MKTVVSVIICVAVLALIGANVVGAQAPALSASLVSGAPSLDGVANDAAWASAQALTVPVAGGSIGNVDVTLKAVYTVSDVYLLLQWPDATLSIDKSMWTYDGSAWAQTGNEDRFGILWNIDESIANFGTSGCTVTCHGDGMYTNADSELGDMWHWKAARGNPVGYVDDKYLNNSAGEADGGRHGDGGASTYSDNADEDENKAPDFVWATNSPSTPVGVAADLAKRFLLKTEEAAFSASNPLTGVAWASGDTVPGYRLREPDGSRADVTTRGVWARPSRAARLWPRVSKPLGRFRTRIAGAGSSGAGRG